MTDAPKLKGSKKARMSMARLAAAQCVYQWIQAGSAARDILSYYNDYYTGMKLGEDELLPPDRELLVAIMGGVQDNHKTLDDMVQGHMTQRAKQNELSKDMLLLSILYCGAYELYAHHDKDTPLIISEYLNVTKAFYEGREPTLINGVLDSLAKNLRS